MSYILEALRRSERERSLGKVPTLDATARQRNGASNAIIWWSLTLLVVASAVVWWLWQGQIGINDATSSRVERDRSDRQITQMPQADTVHRSADSAMPEGAVVNPAAGEVQTTDTITLNVISWSADPARRFAMINQKIVREGQNLSDSINVLTIQPDKVVLDAHGRELILRP